MGWGHRDTTGHWCPQYRERKRGETARWHAHSPPALGLQLSLLSGLRRARKDLEAGHMPSTWEPPLSAQILETKQSNRKSGGDPVARLTCDCSGARRMSGTWGAQGSVPVQPCCPHAPDLRRGQIEAIRMGEIRDKGASPPPLQGHWAGKVRDDVEAGGGGLFPGDLGPVNTPHLIRSLIASWWPASPALLGLVPSTEPMSSPVALSGA